MHKLVRSLRAGVLAVLAVVALSPQPHAQSLPYALFERYLESLREQTGIPGLSAAIVQGQKIVWEVGLGRQDIDRALPARPDTPYPIGDLTQSFAAVLIGQCVQYQGLDINLPVRRWTASIPEATATARHVMAHASAGNPGEVFAYAPSRYASLTSMIDGCGGDMTFRQSVADEIFERVGMTDSVPGADLAAPDATLREMFDEARLQKYAAILGRMATPYQVDRSGRATKSQLPRDVNAATGLVSSARDIARFDIRLNAGDLVQGELLAAAWSNVVTSTGRPLPSGLGWFVQTYNGHRIVWHFGNVPGAASSLVLKVPGRDMTLVLVANSDGLSSPYALSEGDVTASLFAKLFLRLFVG